MRVVVAPDKFKGSLTAAAGRRPGGRRPGPGRPGVEVVQVPVADGGDGTLEAALSAGYRRVPVRAEGPTGEPVDTAYAERDGVAVVELADVSGLRRLPGGRLAARAASSYGTGQVIGAALDAGCRRIVLGIGGSACTDGGAGLVQALGGRLADARRRGGRPGRRGPGRACAPSTCPACTRRSRRPRSWWPATWTTRCWGPAGRRRSTGPRRARHRPTSPSWTPPWPAGPRPSTGPPGPTRRARRAPERPAASGSPPWPSSGRGCNRASTSCSTWSASASALPGARLVICGEGSLDAQTLHGKAPAGVAAAARAAGVPVVAVAGRSLLAPAELEPAGILAAYALTDLEPDPARCMTEAGPLLERLAERVASDWVTDDARR